MTDHYSPDEVLALVISLLIGVTFWAMWYYRLTLTGWRVRRRAPRWPLALVPLACGLLLSGVLKQWSAEDVRTDNAYLLFYMLVGAAWVGLFQALLPLFGLSVRDDVLERGNQAAGWAVTGALLGGTCCFSGANVGNGPGWWVVLFTAFLSTTALLFLWWLIHVCSGVAEKVSVDRDRE